MFKNFKGLIGSKCISFFIQCETIRQWSVNQYRLHYNLQMDFFFFPHYLQGAGLLVWLFFCKHSFHSNIGFSELALGLL